MAYLRWHRSCYYVYGIGNPDFPKFVARRHRKLKMRGEACIVWYADNCEDDSLKDKITYDRLDKHFDEEFERLIRTCPPDKPKDAELLREALKAFVDDVREEYSL